MKIQDNTKRIDELIHVIMKVASGDFSVQAKVSENNDHIDALAMGINMMVDDLIHSFETRQENERISELNRQLKIAKEKAEESDRLKSSFLANMSHEIRTPMNGILGFARLLKKPTISPEKKEEYIDIIEKSGKQLMGIINDIIDISKIEAGQMEVSISATNVNEQLEYILAFFKPEAERKRIRLSLNIPLSSGEFVVNTDAEKLLAIITNLVKNAIKFTIDGTIEIGYQKKQSFLEFFVRDTGVGISPDMKEAIFSRFIQADQTSKSIHEGSGLGLAICKAYVEMLGGRIWVNSIEGEGSEFYFTLPRSAATDETFVSEEPESRIPGILRKNNLRVFIVEDDEYSGIFLRNILEGRVGDVQIVKNGIEAIEILHADPTIDIVLMDMRLPELDGYETTRRIRQFNKDVIIIAQTAYGLNHEREKAIRSGCNDYISKPIDETMLINMLNRHIKTLESKIS